MTRAKSVYAVTMWKVSVVDTESLKNEARALCREIGRIAMPMVTSHKCPVNAIAASLLFPF